MTLETVISTVKFDDNGLVPAIAQDCVTLEVLMCAFMNREALEKTLSTSQAHFFSRSRQSLWHKGETSGNVLDVKAVLYDCDADCILVKVAPRGPACHTGERSCFYRRLDAGAELETPGAAVIGELFRIIESRKTGEPDKSYTASLYAKGLEKIIEKVEEESRELVRAARDEGKKAIVHEMVDLWFHTMVLLVDRGVGIDAVFAEFARRFGIGGLVEKASRKPKTKE